MKKITTKHTTKNYTVLMNALGNFELYSYNTHICTIDAVINYIYVTTYYDYSATTKKHLRWFFADTINASIGINDIRKALENNSFINIDNIPFKVEYSNIRPIQRL